MKRFFPTACLAVVISLLLSAIWPNQSSAAAPTITSLGQIRAQGLGSPGAMAVDAAGNLYVADADGGEVFKFSRFNKLLATFSLGGAGNGLAVTPDGAVMYVARSGEVQIVNASTGEPTGVLAGSVSQLPEFGMVGDVKIDADGNVYVADLQARQIKVYDARGRYRVSFGSAGTAIGQFHQIGGMAIAPGGQVAVADSSPLNARVHVFTLDPVNLGVTAVVGYANGTAANFGTPAALAPCGLAFDDQGRGYLLDYLRSQLRVFSPTFLYLAAYAQTGVGPGQLAAVEDVVYDPLTKRLFVSCDGGRIVMLGIDGGTTPVYVNRPPTVPVPQDPVGGSEVVSATPALQFSPATDADGDAVTYRVAVYRDGTLVSQGNSSSTSFTLSAGLVAENSTYRWTVEAFDSEGVGSGASLPATFVVNAVNESPTAPALVTPLEDEALAGDGRLVWQASSDPDPNDTLLGYRVEVAADAAFATPLLSAQVGGLEIALADFAAYADLADGGAYVWRVMALDSDGLVSASAAPGRFVYDTAVLKVNASVAGANVYLSGNNGYSGQLIGTAPLELRDLAAGVFSVVVEHAGFEPYVAQVNLVEKGSAAVYASLDPAMQPALFSAVSGGINGSVGLTVNGAAAPFLVDFDNDGRLDLLVGDNAGSMTLFSAMQVTSRGKLVFQSGKSLGLQVMPGAVPCVADWNNDGRKDLLVGRTDGLVTLFLNVGLENAPAFAGGVDLTAAGSALSVGGKAAPAVIDLDEDGLKDLVVGNAAGQVLAFLNQGSDAAPQLVAAVPLFTVTGAAVPVPLDWDADGAKDLLISVAGKATVYRNDLAASGSFVAGTSLAISGLSALFPLDVDGLCGKDLLVGKSNGQLAYWTGSSVTFTPAFLTALTVKVDEVAALVAEAAPLLLAQVDKIRQQIAAKNYTGAGKTAAVLELELPIGAARAAVVELGGMCKAK